MKTADIRLPPLLLELQQLISVVEHMVILLISVDSAWLNYNGCHYIQFQELRLESVHLAERKHYLSGFNYTTMSQE